MTPYVDCVFAQKHLEAFVDRELPVNDEILVESHLRWCTTCTARVEDLQTIALVVRSRTRRESRPLANDRDLTAMRSELLRVAGAERDRSLDARLCELGRRCADLRFVWPALGASAAVVLCVGLAETVWRATAEQQPASLAAMIESMADPGSDRNPLRLDGAMLVPRVLHNQGISAYQAGRYDSAVRKFTAALQSTQTPELIYHAAQAYRLKGERPKAVELYEQYLEVSPLGAAANSCRAELEKLRDVP